MINIKKNKINDDSIHVNYSCYCKKYFMNNDKILYILPCCHMIHDACFNKYILQVQYNNLYQNQNLTTFVNNVIRCPQCKNPIETILNEKKIFHKSKYKKYSIDMKTVKLDNSGVINYLLLPLRLINLTSVINKTLLAKTEFDIMSTIDNIFKSFNFKINIIDNTKKNPIKYENQKINWVNTVDNNSKIVIISNHIHNFDPIILYYLFRVGMISSEFVLTTDLGKIAAEKTNALIFRRGVDTNMVEKIKQYLEEKKRILIFPEGSMGNYETLMRFRTGAFYTGAIICPVIIKYKPFIYDDDFNQMILKIITQNEIIVDVCINDFFYPPFDNKKIEQVRDYMAQIGDLEKSRVSNKSVVE